MPKRNDQVFDNGDDTGMDYRELGGLETDEYEELYENRDDVQECYDEDGNEVNCDFCGDNMEWKEGKWVCHGCGQEMDRPTYFNFIGSEPPGADCLTSCSENFPSCREWCKKHPR